MTLRSPRLAIMVLPGLDHFIADIVAGLPGDDGPEVRLFYFRSETDLQAALIWCDQPAQDVIWFEFCWPPFPQLIARTNFAGRRVMVRLHRIEAYGSDHAAHAPWSKIDDVIVVSHDMAARLRAAAPYIDVTTRLHVIYNGVDLARFQPQGEADPWRIGWCGWLSLHKNPNLALQILHQLRRIDPRYRLHISSKGGEPVARDSFMHLLHAMNLATAVQFDGDIAHDRMNEWYAATQILLSTSVYESFGYAIAEAAACGCDIAMLDQPGAAEFWPADWRFHLADHAVAMILASRRERWRDVIASRFSLSRQIQQLRRILMKPPTKRPIIDLPADEPCLWLARAAEMIAQSRPPIRVPLLTEDEALAATTLLQSFGYRTSDTQGRIFFADHEDPQ